ncbi:MAG: peptidase S41, partial [Prochlorococcus sp.]
MKLMLLTTNYRSHPLGRLLVALLSLGLCALLMAPPAIALSDAQQLVVESWRLVNQAYLDPAKFDQVHWRRLREQALA